MSVGINLLHSEDYSLTYAAALRSLRLLRRLERAAAAVYRELYMFIAARLELAGWVESLATLRGVKIGSADCHSEVLLATSRLATFRKIVCYAHLTLPTTHL